MANRRHAARCAMRHARGDCRSDGVPLQHSQRVRRHADVAHPRCAQCAWSLDSHRRVFTTADCMCWHRDWQCLCVKLCASPSRSLSAPRLSWPELLLASARSQACRPPAAHASLRVHPAFGSVRTLTQCTLCGSGPNPIVSPAGSNEWMSHECEVAGGVFQARAASELITRDGRWE